MGDIMAGQIKDGAEVGANLPQTPEQSSGMEPPDMPSRQSTKSPAFQFYPRDFLSSAKVDAMSMTERGAYITLLSRCWLDNGLPTNLAVLARMCRMRPTTFAKMWTKGQIASCFYEKSEKYFNERLDDERRKQSDYKRRQTDRAGKRWEKQRNGDAVALQPPHSTGNALQSSSSSAIASASTKENVSRPQPIIRRRNMNAAFEGPRLYVPIALHAKYIGLRNHPKAEDELMQWYEEVSNEWTDGVRKSESPGSNMLTFWDARFNEKWPPVRAAAGSARQPAWYVKKS
jgi:uncharacterized protein YdaU (DUF1376 family)